jgi:hypothetical protein
MPRSTIFEDRALRLAQARVRTVAAMLALAGVLAALVGATPAMAGLQKEFSVFSACPLSTPGVTQCISSKTVSGQFKIGSKTVAITQPVILQGGIKGTGTELVGASLSKTPLVVPGGLLGVGLLGNLEEVTATSELAGTVILNPRALTTQEGVATSLPMKVKLDNPLLGSTCYIGSDAQPIVAQLTTGTTSPPSPNTPITGSAGTIVIEGDGKINSFSNTSLVDNAFAAPGVNGCAEPASLVVDPAVDLSAGLPAAAGTNTAILNGTIKQAGSVDVQAEAALPELGRCVKIAKGKQGVAPPYYEFENSACTYRASTGFGKYEFIPGTGAGKRFTGTGLNAKLETASKAKISCTGSTNAGEYTGTRSATLSVTFTGCVGLASKEACQSAGAAPGEISTPSLAAELGFIKNEDVANVLQVSVGWDLKHDPAIISATCGASNEPVVVSGSVIAPISAIDKMASAFSLNAKASAGKQAPEAFEEQPNDTLTATFGSGSGEQIGLTTTEKLTNEEKLEIKVKAEG